MPLTGGLGADEHLDGAVFEEQDGRLLLLEPADFHVGGHADAAEPVAGPRNLAPGLEARPVGGGHRILHVAGEVAAIVGGAGGGGVGHLFRADEVAPANLVRGQADIAGRDINQPFDQIGGFRAPGTAVGVDRHGVGVDPLAHREDGRDRVGPRKHAPGHLRRDRRPESVEVRAHVGGGVDAEREHPALRVERRFGPVALVAAVGVGGEGFRAVAGPFHRPAELRRGPKCQRFLRVMKNLRAEAATDVLDDYLNRVFRNLQGVIGQRFLDPVRTLALGMQDVSPAFGVEPGDHGAGFHGAGHDTVVDQVYPGDVVGALEGLGHIRFVTHLPVERHVAGHALPQLRRVDGQGIVHRRHRGQRPIVDVDELQGVDRLFHRFGDHHGDGIADEPYPVPGQQPPAGPRHPATVTSVDRDRAGDVAEAVGNGIGAGVDRQNTRRGRGRPGIDIGDVGVCVGRAQEHRVGFAG